VLTVNNNYVILFKNEDLEQGRGAVAKSNLNEQMSVMI